MKNSRPIFWQQGLFLQPQHFQLTDLYHQSLISPLAGHINPFLWGVSRLEVDESALREKYFSLNQAELFLPDGTLVEYPGNLLIQSRSLEGVMAENRRKLRVFLGLHKWDPAAGNVTVAGNLEAAAQAATRFATAADPEEVEDIYLDGPPGQVKRLSYVGKIFWETEKDQLAQFNLIPIAELEFAEEEVRLRASFIPPALSLKASPSLLGLVGGIQEKVAARCLRLEEYKSPRGMQSSELEPGVFFLLMGLRTISRYAPWLVHVMSDGRHHPLTVYEMLLQMIGELTLFTTSMSATGSGADGGREIPAYDHLNLEKCYGELSALISRLLDEITYGPESIIKLERKDETTFANDTPSGIFSDRNVYYLSLRTGADHEECRRSMEKTGKLSARENLAILVSRALPGIPVHFVPVPPPGLPQVSSTIYFRIDAGGAQWEDIQRQGNIGLHWQEAPEDLTAEVIVLRRS